MRKIELDQLEKITPDNSESFIEQESIKEEQLEEKVQKALNNMTLFENLPIINANPQDSAQIILYVKMPGGIMTPHVCPITYLAGYVSDWIKNQETLVVGGEVLV
jgi:hypothetical protein